MLHAPERRPCHDSDQERREVGYEHDAPRSVQGAKVSTKEERSRQMPLPGPTDSESPNEERRLVDLRLAAKLRLAKKVG